MRGWHPHNHDIHRGGNSRSIPGHSCPRIGIHSFLPSFLPSVSLTVAFFISFISYLDSCFHLVHFLFLHVLPCGQISNLYLLSQRCPQFPTIPSKGKCGRRTKRPKIYRHNEAGAQARKNLLAPFPANS